ncbi:COG5361 Uncharacterized conserved protein [Burkholderiaceae bacterium]
MIDMQSLARRAIVYALPVYEMARMRSSSTLRKTPHGDFADAQGGPESLRRWINLFSHSRRLLNASDRRVVTPNNDTLYTNAWLDLSDGPLLIHTPDTGSRYYVLGLIDMYTNPFAHLGTRTTGNNAQTFWVHGPQWQGQIPEGCIPVACPTHSVWVLGRILAHADEDMAPVHALQDAFVIRKPDGQPAQRVYECSVQPQALPSDAATFVRVVNHEMAINPPPHADAVELQAWAALGIGPGLEAPSDLGLLQQALTETLQELDTPTEADLQGGWKAAVEVIDNFNGDWLTRARVARAYIGILGAQEVLYLLAFRDSTGQVLSGQRNYTLRFPPGGLPQVDAFWSLSLYRKADYLFYDHSEQRFAIGDRTEGLSYDVDGGLTLVIGHVPPTQPTNWLPAPAEAFYLALRLYLPQEVHQIKQFKYPEIEPVPSQVIGA